MKRKQDALMTELQEKEREKEVGEISGAQEQLDESSLPVDGSDSHPDVLELDKDRHVHVLLSLEYHGANYGGWQRQGPNNRINLPSVQGTLERAATVACRSFKSSHSNHQNCGDDDGNTDDNSLFHAVLAGNSGRTDRAVNALDHKCILRLPFAKALLNTSASGLQAWLTGPKEEKHTDITQSTTPQQQQQQSSPFLVALNQALPSDVYVKTCRSLTSKQRKSLKFCRKRYRYLMQMPPPDCARPMKAWNDYSYYVGGDALNIDLDLMKTALGYLVGTHDFLPLSCQKAVNNVMPNTVRTLYSAKLNVLQYPFDKLPWFTQACQQQKQQHHQGENSCKNNQQRPFPPVSCFGGNNDNTTAKDNYNPSQNNGIPFKHLNQFKLICLEFEGNGFLRHQVRRMASVVKKVGMGVWPPECIVQILKGDQVTVKATIDHPKLRGQALLPGRGLWLDKVWISDESNTEKEEQSDNPLTLGEGA